MKDNQTKYFLYARKSSEDDERQVKSIEDQINEVSDHARKFNIPITKVYIESKSAKYPGREVFNEMLKAVIKAKESVVILSWHPDRLARNSVDGGQIIYLIDIGKISKLEFPMFWFEPTPQGLFMLQIAFGQAKYFSDNLSENVKRGNRNKVKRGEWLSNPPFGYIRNSKTGNIDIVPEQAEIVRQLFKLFATSKYSFSDLSRHLFYLGIKNKSGKILKCSNVKHLLTNSVYIGLIRYKGEIFEGNYETIISQELFDEVQSKIRKKAKPAKHINRHNFLFMRIFRCGECGEAITAQIGKGDEKYRYYRCTKKNTRCTQAYVSEESLIKQIKEFLRTIKLPEGWYDEMLDRARVKEIEDRTNRRRIELEHSKKLDEVETKLGKLTNHFLNQVIGETEYLKAKEKLIKLKVSLQNKRLDKRDIKYVQPLKDFVDQILFAQELSFSNNYPEIRAFLRRVSTIRSIIDKQIAILLDPPYDIVLKPDELWDWSPDKLLMKEE